MAAHKARRQMPPPAPTPPLTEIVMIDETKGENEKDVSFEGELRFPTVQRSQPNDGGCPATDCR